MSKIIMHACIHKWYEILWWVNQLSSLERCCVIQEAAGVVGFRHNIKSPMVNNYGTDWGNQEAAAWIGNTMTSRASFDGGMKLASCLFNYIAAGICTYV